MVISPPDVVIVNVKKASLFLSDLLHWKKTPGVENRAHNQVCYWRGSLSLFNYLSFTLAATKEGPAHPEERDYTEGQDNNIASGKYTMGGLGR